MKKKIVQVLLILCICMISPFHSNAAGNDNDLISEELTDGTTTDITIDEGDNVTVVDQTQSDSQTNASAETQTQRPASSSGGQGTDASYNTVRNLRRGASNLLNQWRNSIRSSQRLSGSQLVSAILNGNSLIVVGNHTLTIDEMNDFRDGILGPASQMWTIVHHYNHPDNSDDETPPSDRAVRQAQQGSNGASTSGVRYPGWDRLSQDTQNDAISAISHEENLAPTETQYISVWYPDNNGILRNGRIGFNRNGQFFNDLRGYNPDYRRMANGFRFDLFASGLRDTPYWYNRYVAYNMTPNQSFSASDCMNITYIEEYRITNVCTTDITEIDYDNCERLWTVEDLSTGEIQEFVRYSEDLSFTISGLTAGDYRVTPAIKTNMTTGSTVSYRIYEYMFETSTKNLLWYNETSTKTIYLGGATRALGYIPTGNEFIIHVNSLGEIEQESNYIQRIE